ncbi:hypothetical protein ACFO0N_09795 [Halobium salinum]|uniref:Uncharacterized protein n=1 Tax=Halobium salinum TaxID=1364940 RepID=A0ABD5PBG4_9EURY|nr:hypothetical protein [Halobium salinum]
MTTRTIGNVRGMPELPDIDEATRGILLYLLLALLALAIFVFGNPDGFVVTDFPAL